MAGAFGFVKQPQRGTPSAEMIGQALMQRPMGGAPMDGMGGGMPGMGGPSMMASAPGDAADAALRADGARRMTGPGQLPDLGGIEEDGHSANALNVAVGEALTRMGGGYTTSQNPFKPRAQTAQTLQRLGLSAIEADLLIRTGGA